MAHRLDYYSILGVEKDCHADDIKKAFKQKAKKYHPDKASTERKPEGDANKDGDSSDMFSKIYTALNDPVLRDLYDSTVYDPTSEPNLTIEGDEMFKAFEYAKLYTHNKFVFTEVLPKLVQKYKNEFRFNSGNPCVGDDCKLLNFTDIFIPMQGKPLIVCVNHFYVCDDTCTSTTTQCSLYGECLSKDWAGKNMITAPDDHKCSSTKCSFVQLKDAIYVCNISGISHICTESQCNFKKRVVKKGVYVITCAATSREFGEDLDATLQEGTKSKEDILEAFNLSSRSRKLKYTNASGKEVEVLVDVPWGMTVGEVIEEEEEETWEPHLLVGSNKRSREEEEEDEKEKGTQTNTPKRKRGGKESKKEYKRGGRGAGDKGIYEDVELGPYGMDGGANLDFREEDEAYENLGDYATMRGQIGDEDDIVEEFKEDEEHEFERDIALMDYRLEQVRQSSKQLEANKKAPTQSIKPADSKDP